MRSGAVAAGVVVASLIMLAAATSSWISLLVVAPAVDGVQLPAREVAFSGADIASVSIPAALLGLLTAGATALVGPAGRLSTRAALGARATASLLAAATLVVAFIAVATAEEAPGDVAGNASQVTSTAPAIFVAAAFGVAVLTALLWRPAKPSVGPDQPSRYTVEAVRSEPGGGADEWDLAVLDEPPGTKDDL